jgi:hypothetical protein
MRSWRLELEGNQTGSYLPLISLVIKRSANPLLIASFATTSISTIGEMASPSPLRKIPDTSFSYDDSPNDRPFIRLLTLLPGAAWDGGGELRECISTTHNWDSETGFISHSGGIVTEASLVSQENVQQEIRYCKSCLITNTQV